MLTSSATENEIRGTEKAIRLLIGERRALKSKTARVEARLKLETLRLRAELAGRTHALPTASRFPDVSSFQPNVNLPAVQKGSSVRVGAMLVTKVSEGTGWTDPFGANRLAAMAKLSFQHRGAYAFLHPSESGAAQAEHFLNSLGSVQLTANDFVIADCEVTDSQPSLRVAGCARTFAATIAKHLPSKRWLYGGGPFLRENGVTLDGYDAHWLAAYAPSPFPFVIYGNARTAAWQYSDGKFGPMPHFCPGIGPCDMSIVLR